MSRRASRRWLTDYQLGTISGAILLGIAFAAALSTVPQRENGNRREEANHVDRQSSEQETFWQSATRDPTAVFTLALVFVGSIQAALFFWQLGYMRKGLEDAAIAAKAAEDAARAANESNTTSRELFLSENRPWLSIEVEPVSGVVYRDRKASFNVRLTIVNVGRMPAIDVKILPMFTYTNQATSSDFEKFRNDFRTLLSLKMEIRKETIFPGLPFVEETELAIMQTDIDKSAQFEDIFLPHTFICVQYTFSGAKNIKSETGYIAVICVTDKNGERISFPTDGRSIPKERLRFIRYLGSVAT